MNAIDATKYKASADRLVAAGDMYVVEVNGRQLYGFTEQGAAKYLHPNGRCTCYCEGRCEWCNVLCSHGVTSRYVPCDGCEREAEESVAAEVAFAAKDAAQDAAETQARAAIDADMSDYAYAFDGDKS